MARKTVGSKIAYLARKFPHRDSTGFLYTRKGDLRRHFSTVFVVLLIYDPQRGHSVFIWNPHRRGKDWDYKGWDRWLVKEGLDIVVSNVMLEINAKYGADWEVQRFIGFFGGIYEPRIHVVGEGKTAMDYQKEAKRAIHRATTKRARSRRNKTHGKRQQTGIHKRRR